MASIERRERPSGVTWRVVWRQEVNGRRRKQSMSFPDATQATRFHKLVEGSGNRWPAGWEPLPPGPPDALTFGQWAHTAIEQRTRANERTKADYRRDLERHFGLLNDVPLADLSTEHVA